MTSYSVNTAYEVQGTQTFGEIATKVTDIKENDTIKKVEITSGNSKFNIVVSLITPCEQFSAFSVLYV